MKIMARMNLEAKVGPYIVTTVTDTGTGIPPENNRQNFRAVFYDQTVRQRYRAGSFNGHGHYQKPRRLCER